MQCRCVVRGLLPEPLVFPGFPSSTLPSNRTAPRLAVIVVTGFSLSRRLLSRNLSFYTQVCHCLTQADQDSPSPLKSLGPCKGWPCPALHMSNPFHTQARSSFCRLLAGMPCSATLSHAAIMLSVKDGKRTTVATFPSRLSVQTLSLLFLRAPPCI